MRTSRAHLAQHSLHTLFFEAIRESFYPVQVSHGGLGLELKASINRLLRNHCPLCREINIFIKTYFWEEIKYFGKHLIFHDITLYCNRRLRGKVQMLLSFPS